MNGLIEKMIAIKLVDSIFVISKLITSYIINDKLLKMNALTAEWSKALSLAAHRFLHCPDSNLSQGM